MYRSYFLSKDAQKISEYKRYSNILSRLKSKNKKDYDTMHFSKYKNKLKQTWKLIGSLVKRKDVKTNLNIYWTTTSDDF